MSHLSCHLRPLVGRCNSSPAKRWTSRHGEGGAFLRWRRLSRRRSWGGGQREKASSARPTPFVSKVRLSSTCIFKGLRMENLANLQAKRGVWPTYFLMGMLSPARASSSSDDLAPIISDWAFLFQLSAVVEEKETGRLATLLTDGEGRAVETPGIWHRVHVSQSR